MSEKEVLSCIDYVANTLAGQFLFGYFGLDDVKQNIRMWCLQALPRYKESRGKLSTFLMVHCKNRGINFRRDHLFRMPPKCDCVDCKGGNPCSVFQKKMKRWKKLNTTKRDLMNVNYIDDLDYEIDNDRHHKDTVEHDELFAIIDEYLDVGLREDYRKLIEGVPIPKEKRERVVNEIQHILDDLKYERTA